MFFPDKYTYLLLNIGSILFPLLLSFDKKVAFYKTWKALFSGLIPIGILFILWDIKFTSLGLWGFNPAYILGIKWNGLPLEEILFFITVPYACVFIYACVKSYFGKKLKQTNFKWFNLLFTIAMFIVIWFNTTKLYTLIAFAFLALFYIINGIRKNPIVPFGIFYISYIICLIPFFLVNGVLTSLPVVWYNEIGFIGFRLGTIPLEDLFYNMGLILSIVTIYEYVLQKATYPLNSNLSGKQ